MKFDIMQDGVTLSQDTEASRRTLRIPLLRKALFTAGRYGTLSFDSEFLRSLVENFNNNVVGHELAVNARHKPEYGALGWVERIALEGDNLVVYAKPTPGGQQLIDDEVYKYASAEIDNPFTDRETGAEYGPTLVGLALTNNPYVHRQERITLLSTDDENVGYYIIDVASAPTSIQANATDESPLVHDLLQRARGRTAVERALAVLRRNS